MLVIRFSTERNTHTHTHTHTETSRGRKMEEKKRHKIQRKDPESLHTTKQKQQQ